MKLNGCHNHPPYADSFGSFGLDTASGRIVYFEVPNPNTKQCQYQWTALGMEDKGCIGCVHKESKE